MIPIHDIIIKHKNDKAFMHLARPVYTEKILNSLRDIKQLFAVGSNAKGHPEALVFGRGSSWLERLEQNQSRIHFCCNLYKLYFKPSAKIFYVKTIADLTKLDKAIPSYWLNMDYIDLSYVDYLTKKRIKSPKIYELDYAKLLGENNTISKESLVRNKIIFTNPEDAIKYCKFYKNTKIPIERFKYKDWAFAQTKYDGIVFDIWNINSKRLMYYFWYQALDRPLGYIWNIDAIKKYTHIYKRVEGNNWTRVR